MRTNSKPAPPDPTRTPPPIFLPPTVLCALGANQVAKALAISRVTFWKMVSRGDYPPSDMRVGSNPRWSVETHNEWMQKQRRDAGELPPVPARGGVRIKHQEEEG